MFGYSVLGFGAGGKAYDPDAVLHFQRMQSKDPALLDAINTLIITLKFYGIWALLDAICVVCDNEADSLLNLKGATYDATNINGATFTVDRGFTIVATGTDGVNPGYINANIVVGGSTLASDHDNSIFIYQRTTQTTSNVYLIGVAETNPLALFYSGSSSPDTQMFISNVFTGPNPANDAAVGFIGGTRRPTADYTVDGDAEIRVNGVVTNYTQRNINQPIDQIDVFVGAANSSGAPNSAAIGHQFAAWGIGAGLSPSQHANLELAIQTYMTARGAAV